MLSRAAAATANRGKNFFISNLINVAKAGALCAPEWFRLK